MRRFACRKPVKAKTRGERELSIPQAQGLTKTTKKQKEDIP